MFFARMRALERREFLQTLGAAGASALLGCARRPQRLTRIGVQLYTVRAELERDFDGTLSRLAELGYREVEFAGYFGRTPAQVRAAIARAGLTAPGSHVAFETLLGEFERTAGDAAAAGHGWVVVPWLPESARRTAADWRRVVELFNRGGERARATGVRFAYHNQAYDWNPVEAMTPFDVVATETEPGLVDFELDVYWAVKGGSDPLRLIERFPGRFPLMHFKDAAGPEQTMVDVGAGSIDWRAILSRGAPAGLRHVFVEHDTPADPFASVRAGFEYLQGVAF
jgi:sugar phosphate isomerase/epimerase